MSKGRVFSRPRTKVYDTNYNIGESYYRPALDRLDRKYGGGFGDLPRGGGVANGDTFGLRSPPPPPQSPMDLPSPRAALRDMEDEFFKEGQRRRPNSAFLGELDSIFEGRMRNGTSLRGTSALDDEIEENLSSSMKRLRAKASRSLANEFEDIDPFPRKESRMRAKLDFGEKMMDTVGLTGSARQALEEEGSTVGRRRYLKMTSMSDVGEGEDLTRWTALKPGAMSKRSFLDEEQQETSVAQSAAAARARKSRARLEDLESEMQAISEKSAAREKRVRDLKALVQDNEASALDNLQTTVRVKSSIQSEKKTVTF